MSSPNDSDKLYLGIDLSTERLISAAVTADGVVRERSAAVVDRNASSIGQLRVFIEGLLPKMPNMVGVGLSVPGLINRKTGRVEFSAEFPEHSRIDLLDELRSAAKVPAILENDANAAAFGEFALGAGKGSRDMFFALLSRGIGGSFIFGGEIWHGVSGFAGEFGYMAINSDGMRLEDVASSSNIVRRTRSRFHQDSTSILGRLDEDAISISEIVRAAANEDDFAVMMLERTGVYIGSAIASVINLLNIERIVLGGEIMEAGPVVLTAITRRAQELSFGPSFANTTIVAGELGREAAAVGAALLARNTVAGGA